MKKRTVVVVEATINGEVCYLRSNSVMDDYATDDPLQARDFSNLSREDLSAFLAVLRMPGDQGFAKSGLPVDTAVVKRFNVHYECVDTSFARAPHQD